MENKSLWESILVRLAPVVSRQHILSFFKDVIVQDVTDGVMVLGVPHVYCRDFIFERYLAKVLQAAKSVIREVREIKFEVKGGLVYENHPYKADLKVIKMIGEEKTVRKLPNKQEVVVDGMRSKMLNSKYSLQNYISGEENRLAYAACMAVAARPGDIYNPLYLYGGVGLGKTHLLQATGIEIIKNHPGKNVVYMTSERFINEIVDAIGRRHTSSFKDRYRKVDCLIVDDIQFFGNKASSQQEFFHTFNELYDARKQIIISSDRPPRELDALEERLKSRFGMGMVVEVNVPEFETRQAILNAKCQEMRVLIDREVLEFIAYNVNHSVRELEGILINAVGEAQLTHSTPTIRSVAEAIRKLNNDQELKGLKMDLTKRLVIRSAEDVMEIVANYYKLTKSDLLGEERRKEIMVPRQVCMYLIREMLDQPYETIGESFGGRNHTTVIHAYNKILGELRQDSRIKRDINALKKEMGV